MCGAHVLGGIAAAGKRAIVQGLKTFHGRVPKVLRGGVGGGVNS